MCVPICNCEPNINSILPSGLITNVVRPEMRPKNDADTPYVLEISLFGRCQRQYCEKIVTYILICDKSEWQLVLCLEFFVRVGAILANANYYCTSIHEC